MNVKEALIKRKSVRAYLKKDVERKKINAIIDAARHSPSGVNTQPWQVAIVTGRTKEKLQDEIEAAFRSGDWGQSDYPYYPSKWVEPFKSRRQACGQQMYDALKIDKEDSAKKMEQWAANYRSFGAPVMLLFFMDGDLQTGSILDYGMFLQSIMLAAVDQGLATCPQASIADYPELIKAELDYPEDSVLICAMALGYEDKRAKVNKYRTPREEIESFTRFYI